MFVPHRQNGDVMQRPYKSVRNIYRVYVAKLNYPNTFLWNQTESERPCELELRSFNNHCIVCMDIPISRKNFSDLSKGRQFAFTSLSIGVYVIRVRSMDLFGTWRSALGLIICGPMQFFYGCLCRFCFMLYH